MRVFTATQIDTDGMVVDTDELLAQLQAARELVPGQKSTVSFTFHPAGGDPRERDTVTIRVS